MNIYIKPASYNVTHITLILAFTTTINVSITPFQDNSQSTIMSLYPSNVLKSQYEMWILLYH